MSIVARSRTRVARRPAVPANPRHGFDGVSILTVYLVLLLAVPSSLTFTALSSLGRPDLIWALFALLLWCWHQVNRHETVTGVRRHPVRTAAFLLLAVAFVSFAWAMLRGLPATESTTATTSLLRLIALVGVLLVASDEISDVERLRTLLRRVVLGGALMASLGLVQFFTGQTWLDGISIPGMSVDASSVVGVADRNGFIRAAGTASQPLEYAMVLSIALPIALSLAFTDTSRSWMRRWTPVTLIILASVLSVSRSALIGLLVGVLILMPAWSRKVRIYFGAVAAVGLVAVGLLVPGMIGTIRGMFLGAGSDPSTVSRFSSYGIAEEFISRFPIVGKSFGTLLPSYHIFDNEFLLLTIELGLVGLAAFLGLFAASTIGVLRTKKLCGTRLNRHLWQALAASTISGGFLMAFFDGLSFAMAAGLLFLTFGLCGAAHRLASDGQSSATL